MNDAVCPLCGAMYRATYSARRTPAEAGAAWLLTHLCDERSRTTTDAFGMGRPQPGFIDAREQQIPCITTMGVRLEHDGNEYEMHPPHERHLSHH